MVDCLQNNSEVYLGAFSPLLQEQQGGFGS
jgi:hypothetical protein